VTQARARSLAPPGSRARASLTRMDAPPAATGKDAKAQAAAVPAVPAQLALPPEAAEMARAAQVDEPKYETVVMAAYKRQGDNLSLLFPFAAPTPAAVFSRADTLWLVFDTSATIGLAKLEGGPSGIIKSASMTQGDGVAVVRIKLERPRLVSATADGPVWAITLGSEVLEPTRPLAISRNVIGAARASIIVPFDDPRGPHRIADPEAGDTLLVVTALAPARGFVRSQDFVEFRALASTHGVVVQPLADD